MRGIVLGCLLWSVVVLPAGAVTPSPALTDREIAERLTRMETRLDEGLTGLRGEMGQLRGEMGQLRDDMNSRFEEQGRQNRQLRTDMNSRFEEQGRILLGIVAAFAALIAVNIGLMVWDRRTAARPFEDKVSKLTEEVTKSNEQGQTVLEVLRAIGQQNQTVAAVLRRFNLL